MMISLKMRLITGVVIGTAVLLGVFCVLVYIVTNNTLLHSFDNSLLSTAKLLSAVVEDDREHHDEKGEVGEEEHLEEKGALEFEFDVRMLPAFNNLNGGDYYQFWDDSASVFARSPSLGESDLPYFGDESVDPVYQRCVLPDGKAGRVVSYGFSLRTGEGAGPQKSITLVVGRDASEVYGFLGFFSWLLLNCSLIIVVLSSYVAAKVSRVGLGPVHTLATEIAAVDEQALERSFSSDRYPVELVPICECLNALMERIRNSFERERHFNSDVAHELRTPIAGIRSILEVTLTRQREIEEYKSASSDCLDISKKMQAIVENLLTLARLDSKQMPLHYQSIHFKKFIDSAWHSFGTGASSKKITFENNVPDDLTVSSDPDQLGIIVSNLIDNSVEYTNAEGLIQIDAEQSADSIKIIFVNTGCQLTDEQLPHVFDCFWRGDSSRTDTGLRCGLGLALVQRIIKILGGTCIARTNVDRLFILELSFPANN